MIRSTFSVVKFFVKVFSIAIYLKPVAQYLLFSFFLFSSYSRYSIRRESNNSGPLSPLVKPRDKAPSQHSVSSDIRNQLNNKNHTVMHGRTQPSGRNITSLDNPLVDENR